ncbi:MAG: hypothetical protein ACPG4Y_09910, partial [Chitinophagales bacterium]
IIMLLREKVQEQIALLPEKFSLDELVEKLILIEKIQKGIHQSENDEVTSDEDLDREISKW